MAKGSVILNCSKCGAEYTTTKQCYNRRAADSWEEWMKQNAYGLCPACFKKQREQEKAVEEQQREENNIAAAERSKAMGLPTLNGTQRQVKWASTIRQSFVDDAIASKLTDIGKKVLNYIIDNVIDAHEWIDTRNENAGTRMYHYRRIMDNNHSAVMTEAQIADEETIKPKQSQSPGAVKISIKDDDISASYPKDDVFINIVKSLGYKWSPSTYVWHRQIEVQSGPSSDRAAELGNKLLLAGFSIRISDSKIRQAAIDGTYEPECKRWITYYVSGRYEGYLCISFERGNEGIYEKARLINGSRWNSPDIAVPISEYQSVLDFADVYGFKIGETAKREIDKYKKSVTIVTPKVAQKEKQSDKLADILKSSADIPEDLKDDS